MNMNTNLNTNTNTKEAQQQPKQCHNNYEFWDQRRLCVEFFELTPDTQNKCQDKLQCSDYWQAGLILRIEQKKTELTF